MEKIILFQPLPYYNIGIVLEAFPRLPPNSNNVVNKWMYNWPNENEYETNQTQLVVVKIVVFVYKTTNRN